MSFLDLTLFGIPIGLDSLLALAVPLLLYFCLRRPSGLPPFPATPLPVLGNLLSLEKDPRNQFGRWKKKHGDIFSIYFGPKLTIVLNSFDAIREALVKKADVFSDRPDLATFSLVLRGKGILSTSGPHWKSQRKFSLTAMRQFGFGRKTIQTGVLEEARNVLEFFASKKGKKHEFSEIYNISTSNVICLILFGHRFDFDDPTFLACCQALNTVAQGISDSSLVNVYPMLMKIPGAAKNGNNILKNFAFFEEHLIEAEIKRHYDAYDGTTPDFVAAYIKEIKDREIAGLDASELKDNFKQTINDLFIGGTETTATTLKWMILFLIRYPEVQEKCFQEIKDNIGLERFPSLEDKTVLPYLEAMIAETQRRANIAPFGVLHAASENTTFRGYNIPKGTAIMTNLDSILMDPKLWPEPEKFRPERFLDKSGAFFKPEYFIPFSTGRRVCLGEALAKIELFLFSAALIQNFKFLQPDDEPTPSLVPNLSNVAFAKPYKVRAVQRGDQFPNVPVHE